MSSAPFSALMHQAYRSVDAFITKSLQERGFNVTGAHSAVLANIDIEGGTRATVLAQRASVTKQAIGEVVADLEGKGIVRRVPDPLDGRAKLVRLTKKGRALIDAAKEVIGEIEAGLAARSGARNVATTKRTLVDLIAILADPPE